MEAEHYKEIVIAFIQTVGVVLAAVGGGMATYYAARGLRHSKQTNEAVNQNIRGSRRLYDIAAEGLSCSQQNSARLDKVEKRLEEGEEQFALLFEYLREHNIAKEDDEDG